MRKKRESIEKKSMGEVIPDSPEVEFVLDKTDMDREEKAQILLRISYGDERQLTETGLRILPRYWDEVMQMPIASAPDYDLLLDGLVAWHDKAEYALSHSSESSLLPASLNEKRSGDLPKAVGIFGKRVIERLEKHGQLGNADGYKYAISMLRSEGFDLNKPFTALDSDYLERLLAYMRQRGLKENTIGNIFRKLKALWNRAINEGVAPIDAFPFNKFKTAQFKRNPKKRALTKEDMLRVMNYQIEDDDQVMMELAKDMFVFSYLMCGMNLRDIMQLKKENIHDGVLTFVRNKTKEEITIGIPKEASAIIRKYHSSNSGYLFPYLERERGEKEMFHFQHKKMNELNHCLSTIGEKLGLPFKLTFYVARHTFATVMKREGVGIGLIAQMMGHTSTNTTMNYLLSFKDEQKKDAMNFI